MSLEPIAMHSPHFHSLLPVHQIIETKQAFHGENRKIVHGKFLKYQKNHESSPLTWMQWNLEKEVLHYDNIISLNPKLSIDSFFCDLCQSLVFELLFSKVSVLVTMGRSRNVPKLNATLHAREIQFMLWSQSHLHALIFLHLSFHLVHFSFNLHKHWKPSSSRLCKFRLFPPWSYFIIHLARITDCRLIKSQKTVVTNMTHTLPCFWHFKLTSSNHCRIFTKFWRPISSELLNTLPPVLLFYLQVCKASYSARTVLGILQIYNLHLKLLSKNRKSLNQNVELLNPSSTEKTKLLFHSIYHLYPKLSNLSRSFYITDIENNLFLKTFLSAGLQ